MSPTFYPCPDNASSIVRERVEVCLRRIFRDSVGAGQNCENKDFGANQRGSVYAKGRSQKFNCHRNLHGSLPFARPRRRPAASTAALARRRFLDADSRARP